MQVKTASSTLFQMYSQHELLHNYWHNILILFLNVLVSNGFSSGENNKETCFNTGFNPPAGENIHDGTVFLLGFEKSI